MGDLITHYQRGQPKRLGGGAKRPFSTVSAFGLVEQPGLLLTFVSIYFVICYIGILGWAMLGAKLGHILAKTGYLKRLNQVMGAALVAVALYLLALHFH